MYLTVYKYVGGVLMYKPEQINLSHPIRQNIGGPFRYLISNIGERVPLLLSLYAALTGTWLCMMERSGLRHWLWGYSATGKTEWSEDLSANGYLHKILVLRWNNKSPHLFESVCFTIQTSSREWLKSLLSSLRKIIINKINNKTRVEEIKYLMEARNKLSPD